MSTPTRRACLAAALATPLAVPGLAPRRARAADAPGRPLRLGVLTDFTGIYMLTGGKGAVEATRMAAETFGNRIGDRPIEILFADHQNKPDIGSAIARQWLDEEHVDVLIDAPNSSVALAVMELANQHNRVFLPTGAGAGEISGAACNPVTLQWTFDSHQMAASLVRPLFERGGDTWYHIMPNYVFGEAVLRDVSAQLAKLGGKSLGAARPPLENADYSTYLMAALASGAKVLSLGTVNTGTATAVKQATEFGIPGKMTIGAFSLLEADVQGIGLPTAQGLVTAACFVWDRTPEVKAWSLAFKSRTGRVPAFTQAGAFSAVRHWLAAVRDTGTTDADKVVERMKQVPVTDIFATHGRIREDGLMVHDWYLRQVKSPAESTGPDDLFKTLATVPGDQAARPLSESQCKLVRKA
mgnify:CR=1 FL=1